MKRATLTFAARIGVGTVILVMISLLAVPYPHGASAQIGGGQGETPFGGMNIIRIACLCNATAWIILHDYATDSILSLHYQPGQSKLYLYYNVFGTYLLGSYKKNQNGQCSIYVGVGCVTIVVQDQLGNQPGTGTTLL